MKTGAIIAIVAGALILIFWATSRGLIQSGVQVGPTGTQRGIVAPQPAQNYSGYLAATTAPQVSGILNGLLSGLSGSVSSWFGKSAAPQPVAQGTNANSPALAATGSAGVAASILNTTNQQYIATLSPSTYSDPGSTLIGPQVDPALQYAGGSAFDYAGLAADNAYDPAASMGDYTTYYG